MFLRPAFNRALTALYACAALSAAAQSGAPANPAAAVGRARALYYTPADKGLQGFHCDLSFDWKNFIQKATNQPLPDDDARLKYLRTIQLSVDDDLHGTGEMHWTAATPAPEGTEDSVGKVRDGMQQLWSGFFQSWNGFFTGGLLALDNKASVEKTPAGYRVATRDGESLAEEFYNDKLVLQSVHVATPRLESTMAPTFSPSSQGLLVTAIRSIYRQPPTAEPTEVTMGLTYAPVNTFQLPSELTVSVGPANFDFHLGNCTVKTQLTPK